MFDWLKRRIDAFFSWLTESLTEYFKWAKDVVDAWYKWAADLIKAIFKAAWDMFTDAVSWLIEKLFEIIKAALDAVDVSSLKGIADNINLPPEIVTVMQLSGIGTAVGIVVTAIGIRLALQLIPFTRLGS